MDAAGQGGAKIVCLQEAWCAESAVLCVCVGGGEGEDMCQISTDPGHGEREAALASNPHSFSTVMGAHVVFLSPCICRPMPFAFCTREKQWCEFAESAETGESVALCQRAARRWAMRLPLVHAGNPWLRIPAIHPLAADCMRYIFLSFFSNVIRRACLLASSAQHSHPLLHPGGAWWSSAQSWSGTRRTGIRSGTRPS